MSSNKKSNPLISEFKTSIVLTILSFLIGIISILAKISFDFKELKEIPATDVILLIFVTTLVFLTPIIVKIRNDLNKHKIYMKDYSEQTLKNLENFTYLFSPDILAEILPNKKKQFNILLSKSLYLNKAKMISLIEGDFYLSSDTFESYYIDYLLEEPDVTYYYSIAMITETEYFQKNRIEELMCRYEALAENKDEFYFLWFIKKGVDKLKFEKQKEQLERNNDNIVVTIADYDKLVKYKAKKYIRDFGIAGDIAGAEMIDGVEKDIKFNNSNIDVEIKDRYVVSFRDVFHKELIYTLKELILHVRKREDKDVKIPNKLLGIYPSIFQ